MTEIEKAEQKFKETRAALEPLKREATELPELIADAAWAGEVEKVAELLQRQARLKSEIFVANVQSREAQIALFEAQKADADERAERAVAIRAEAMPKLGEEETRLLARLRELPIEAQRLHNAVSGPQEESRDLASKITKCREELDRYIDRESKGEPTPAMIAAPMQLRA